MCKQITQKESVTRSISQMAKCTSKPGEHYTGDEIMFIANRCYDILHEFNMEEHDYAMQELAEESKEEAEKLAHDMATSHSG